MVARDDNCEAETGKGKSGSADGAAGHSDAGPAGGPSTATAPQPASKEVGGRKGPDPTRYGDWEKGGRCIDF